MSDHRLNLPGAPETIWIGDVCRVCQRAPVRTTVPGARAAHACEQCLTIDRALGARYLARLLTPLDPTFADGHAVVHDRLWGDRAVGIDDRLRAHHVKEIGRLTHQARDAGLERVSVRHPGGPPWALFLQWDAWTWQFPSTSAASLAGYQRYSAAVHPWIDSVEPRVSDLGWLASTVHG